MPHTLKEKSVRVTEIQSEHIHSIREKVNVSLGHGLFKVDHQFQWTRVIISYKSYIKNCGIVHSLSSGKVEMFLCAACHAFTPHVNAWKR